MSKNKSSGEKRQQLLEMRSILDTDLRQQGHCALATQRRAVQEAAAQERAVIASLAAGLAPCVGQEAALVREVEQAEEVVARMVAAVARDQEPECEALLGPGPATFSFVTPPPSPGPGVQVVNICVLVFLLRFLAAIFVNFKIQQLLCRFGVSIFLLRHISQAPPDE